MRRMSVTQHKQLGLGLHNSVTFQDFDVVRTLGMLEYTTIYDVGYS